MQITSTLHTTKEDVFLNQPALIGEKKPEFIFDGDTTEAMDKLAPGMPEQLLVAKTKPQVDSILQSYMNYSSPMVDNKLLKFL